MPCFTSRRNPLRTLRRSFGLRDRPSIMPSTTKGPTMVSEESLFPCEYCHMLCPPPPGESLHVSQFRGSRCLCCSHGLYERRQWKLTQLPSAWEVALWKTRYE